MAIFRTHTDALSESSLRRRCGVHQENNHTAGVRDTALQSVDAHDRAEERDVVGHIHNHPYVGVDRIERWSRRRMDVNPYNHRHVTVSQQYHFATK